MTENNMNGEAALRLLDRMPAVAWSNRVSPTTGAIEWLYFNPRLADLYGVPASSLQGDPMVLAEHIVPEDRARLERQIAVSLETLAPMFWTGRITHGSGEVRWFEMHSTHERDAEGRVISYGNTTDVTDRKRAEEALAASEEANRALIERLRYSIDELSNPILEVWDDVLVMPIIGVVDSRRTADMVQRLLTEVVRAQASFVIVDLTGVEVVDTRTADHLMKLMRKVEVVGARCVLTGIRPAVADTLVDIGVDFSRVTTLRNLKHGLREAMRTAHRAREGSSDLASDDELSEPSSSRRGR